MSASHPIHPAIVHFPIAFLTLSYTLDLGYKYAPFIFKSVPGFNQLPIATVPATSYFILSLGLLSAIPTVISGGMELMKMIKKQDLANKLNKSGDKVGTVKKVHPKLKVAFAHAALMDISILGSAYSWYTRRAITGYVPSDSHALGSAALILGIFGAATLGGMLTFDYGVGVSTAHRTASKDE